MKFLAYTVAWLLLITQWNDIKDYYYNPVTPVPVWGGHYIRNFISRNIQGTNQGKNKITRSCWHRAP